MCHLLCGFCPQCRSLREHVVCHLLPEKSIFEDLLLKLHDDHLN